MNKKIAIFGGTFDPIHKAHLEIIKKLFLNLNIDKVIVIPTNVSYYKKNNQMFTYDERIKICRLAINNDEYLKNKEIEISDIERNIDENEGYSHTLIKLKSLYNDDILYTVIGSDSYNYINTWRNYEDIIKNSKLVVVTRPNNIIDESINILYDEIKLNDPISSTKIRNDIEKYILSNI